MCFIESFYINDISHIPRILFLLFITNHFLLVFKPFGKFYYMSYYTRYNCNAQCMVSARYRIEYLRLRCGDFYERAPPVNADLSINWLTHRDRAESRSPLAITMTPVR